ncbi:MAG: LacI family transcriptional regulator [Erysipelotrichia bacterium]|nr:LacI family transcriptional regulator [Erysipelotrichia bacterium]
MKKLTMKEIAKEAGVGKSTISRYFNGGYVKAETKEAILKVIDKYNYEPNAFARLKAKRSNIIGIVAPSLDTPVTARVLMAIDETLNKENYISFILNTNHDVKKEIAYLEKLWRLNVDGIVLSATYLTSEHEKLLSEIDIPVVVCAQRYKKGISVVNDDYEAGKMIGKYIGERNHKRILYLGVSEKDEAVGVIRKQGILDGLKECEVSNITVRMSDFSYESAQREVAIALRDKHFDAIICASDRLAFGAYKVIKENGLSIPEDISLVGFGGYEFSELLSPKLTTVKFNSYRNGELVAETLLKMINQEKVAKGQVVGFKLIEGNSVMDRN